MSCFTYVVTDFQFRGLDFQIVAPPVKQAILAEPSILRLLGYKYFLIEFRKADIQNAASKLETTVNVVGASYHFRAPNFQLVAHTTNNQRFDLTDYNHVDVPKSVDFGKLSNAGNAKHKCVHGNKGHYILQGHFPKLIPIINHFSLPIRYAALRLRFPYLDVTRCKVNLELQYSLSDGF